MSRKSLIFSLLFESDQHILIVLVIRILAVLCRTKLSVSLRTKKFMTSCFVCVWNSVYDVWTTGVMNLQQPGQNHTVRISTVCTHHQILIRWTHCGDWDGRVCSMNGELRNACKILVGKPEGKKQLGTPTPEKLW